MSMMTSAKERVGVVLHRDGGSHWHIGSSRKEEPLRLAAESPGRLGEGHRRRLAKALTELLRVQHHADVARSAPWLIGAGMVCDRALHVTAWPKSVVVQLSKK